MLVAIVFATSSSYLLTKLGVANMGAFNLIALRFLVAFAALAICCAPRLLRASRKTLCVGALLGAAMFAILALQAFGLSSISTTEGAFLSSTTVAFVPILQALIMRRLPRGLVVAGVAATMVGIAFITSVGFVGITQGALFYLVGAVVYAVHILIVDRCVGRIDALAAGIFELLFAGILSAGFSFVFESPRLPEGGGEWACVLGLALVCSAFGMGVQPVVQQYTTAERYGVLFGLSPLFSALLGMVCLGEAMGAFGWLGAAFVLAGVLVVVRTKDEKSPHSGGLLGAETNGALEEEA